MLEDGHAHRAFDANGCNAIVERAPTAVAGELQVVRARAGHHDKRLTAVAGLGEEGRMTGRWRLRGDQ
jgi:hypothetical protein